jgi:hypothetical protein
MTTPQKVAQIKSKLLRPATTSHFYVTIDKPFGLSDQYLRENGIYFFDRDKLNLLCCEASLPGSSIATHDITNDFHGVTEKHAYRRLYDDRIDLTFYVDEDNYLPIRFFETWIKYVAGEEIASRADSKGKDARPGTTDSKYYYRMNYPDEYMLKKGLSVTKFERSYTGRNLRYEFVNSFPISINSMPVSYDASSLLKCTVSFNYIRYVLIPDTNPPGGSSGDNNLTPEQQATANNLTFNPDYFNSDLGLNYGDFTTTGGVNYSSAFASGNTIDTKTAFSSNTNLF